MRLNKFLAERLGISRREADDAIAAGKVTVGGKVAKLGDRVDFLSGVCYNSKIVPFQTDYAYIAMNKSRGVVCSRKSQDNGQTVYDLLPAQLRTLKTVGRLDKDSEGLILLTNDGDFAFRMTHPKFAKTKIYEVELDRKLEPLHQQMIADFGIELADGKSRLGLERMDDGRRKWRVMMSEGRNRQIRRTFGALGYTVMRLKRTAFGMYALDGLKEGAWTEVKKV